MTSGDDGVNPTPKKREPAWRAPFLAELRVSANVRKACEVAGINRDTAYHTRATVVHFAAQWATAMAEACDLLEAEARRRALEISDTLLIFLLKSHRPEVYRDRLTIDLRHHVEAEAERIAQERGLPVADVMEEARRLLSAAR